MMTRFAGPKTQVEQVRKGLAFPTPAVAGKTLRQAQGGLWSAHPTKLDCDAGQLPNRPRSRIHALLLLALRHCNRHLACGFLYRDLCSCRCGAMRLSRDAFNANADQCGALTALAHMFFEPFFAASAKASRQKL